MPVRLLNDDQLNPPPFFYIYIYIYIFFDSNKRNDVELYEQIIPNLMQ